MVRKMNVLATLMQSFAMACLVTVLWMVVGHSLAFTGGSSFVGGLSRFLLLGMTLDSVNDLARTIPESVYICYQMTFAIITPAPICGSFADRMTFSALLWFIGLWTVFVYAPIAPSARSSSRLQKCGSTHSRVYASFTPGGAVSPRNLIG